MRRVLSILITLAVLGGFARAYTSRNAVLQQPVTDSFGNTAETADDKLVDFAADIAYPYDLGNDSSVICLVGNFIGHHNGAVITCDSAVRYSNKRFECFGNVLINKNDTYIYGERADYNGAINEAQVYSQLVKVIDGDATLYTYKFKFNTKLNIGEFGDGGVVTNRDNILEADRGYYYADSREVIGVDEVEMRNDQYQMNGDSVIYNIESDFAQFFTGTNIWNDRGEYLYADRGNYDKDEEKYVITRNGYILTDLREVWSDSIDYYREQGYALLRRDIQLDDSEHKTLSFGDWGEYWDENGDAFMTRDPSMINYDPEQGDSLFMRADSIFMNTRSTVRDRREQEEAEHRAALEAERQAREAEELLAEQEEEHKKAEEKAESESEPAPDDDKAEAPTIVEEETDSEAAIPAPQADSLHREAADSVSTARPAVQHPEAGEQNAEEASADGENDAEQSLDTEDAQQEQETPLSELSKEERKARLREIAEQEREAKKKAADEKKKAKQIALKAKLDSIGEVRQAKRNLQLDKQKRRDSIAQAKTKARAEARRLKAVAKLTKKGIKILPPDAATLAQLDSTVNAEIGYYDSLTLARFDSIILSWLPDTTGMADSLLLDTTEIDTVYRLVRGFRHVRMYRSDFQAVCDSVSSSTLDTVIHMYIEPVMWNEQNQITSETTDIYTRNQQIEMAQFEGKPLMISKIDTLHFNQVAGKTMFSYFRDNQIYRDDVNGNAETIYYMQEDGDPEVQGLMYITSGDMTFYIEEQQVSTITYRGNPEYWLYPMDKIPETQPLFLQGFTWQEERRPARDSIMTRTIRPSIRAEKEALAKPSFPIAERINDYRRRLVEQNRWYDRNETLSEDAVYWLDTHTDWREYNERDREKMQQQRSAD